MADLIGKHILAEYFACENDILDDLPAIRQMMMDAADRCQATIVGEIFHQFNPIGVTGVVVIAESHLAIHTWPELRYASVDLFTCGTSVDPWVGFEYIKNRLQSRKWAAREIIRGTLEGQHTEHHRKWDSRPYPRLVEPAA